MPNKPIPPQKPPKRPIGRPSKYKPEYCDQLIAFFDQPLTHTLKKTYTTKAGTVIEEDIQKPNLIPTFEMFANSIGTLTTTLDDWSKKNPEFHHAYMRAKQMQKNFLSQNALNGGYNPVFSKFWAINCLGMKDQMDVGGNIGLNVTFSKFEGIKQTDKPNDKPVDK